MERSVVLGELLLFYFFLGMFMLNLLYEDIISETRACRLFMNTLSCLRCAHAKNVRY